MANERIDRALIIQQLKELYASAASNPNSKYDPDKILEETVRLMGLDTNNMAKDRTQSALDLIVEKLYGKPAGMAAPQANAAAVKPGVPGLAGRNLGQLTANAQPAIASLPNV